MCFLGLHKWSKWGDVKVGRYAGAEGVSYVQYRWCYKCHKADQREV